MIIDYNNFGKSTKEHQKEETEFYKLHLLANGMEQISKDICAHTGVTIKLNNKKTIKLDMGEFYNMKEGEVITHKKYIGFDKFIKVK